jgi:short-subunit dehydrogenase
MSSLVPTPCGVAHGGAQAAEDKSGRSSSAVISMASISAVAGIPNHATYSATKVK